MLLEIAGIIYIPRFICGNILSAEGKKIFAGERKNQLKGFNNIGEGTLLIDKENSNIEKVKFKKISDSNILYKEVIQAMDIKSAM